jgi:hypothetical protein
MYAPINHQQPAIEPKAANIRQTAMVANPALDIKKPLCRT